MHSGGCFVKELNAIHSSTTPAVRHSLRRFYRVSVCAKLSYTIAHWQTIAQTIPSLIKLRHCSRLLSEAALWRSKVPLKTLEMIRCTHCAERGSYSLIETVGKYCWVLNITWSTWQPTVNYVTIRSPSVVLSLAKGWKIAVNMNVFTEYFACTCNINATMAVPLQHHIYLSVTWSHTTK